MATRLRRQRRQHGNAGGAAPPRRTGVALVVPVLVLVAAIGALTGLGLQLMDDLARGDSVALAPPLLLAAAAAFVLASAVAVAVQAARVADRVGAPEHRLCQSLRRMRGGDLAFRVHLRRGDLLGDLARECNELLDWLNRCPPAGCHTGTDLVDIAPDRLFEEQPELAEETAAP